MIDPRTTNIAGQRVSIVRRCLEPLEREVLGHGVVRVVDYSEGHFDFLIEASEKIESARFQVSAGALVHVSTWDEEVEVVVDREVPPTPTSSLGSTNDDDIKRAIRAWGDMEIAPNTTTLLAAARELLELRAEVTEMYLCEARRVVLRPGVLYRFTVAPDCAACKQEASGAGAGSIVAES